MQDKQLIINFLKTIETKFINWYQDEDGDFYFDFNQAFEDTARKLLDPNDQDYIQQAQRIADITKWVLVLDAYPDDLLEEIISESTSKQKGIIEYGLERAGLDQLTHSIDKLEI